MTETASKADYERLRTLSWWVLGAMAAIIVSGATVRLTGSGLGCPDWPNCTEQRIVSELTIHGMIEQINRFISIIIVVPVAMATRLVLTKFKGRQDLRYLLFGMFGVIMAEVVLGAITVWSGLAPQIVMGHMILGMATLVLAAAFQCRAVPRSEAPTLSKNPWVLTVATLVTVTVFAGAVVTGSGPHGGEEDVPRFALDVSIVARVHSVLAWLSLIAAAITSRNRHRAVRSAALTVAAVLTAQGIVGYIQYFTGVPVGLVWLHMVGAVICAVAATRLAFTGQPEVHLTRRAGPLPNDAIST